MEQGRDKHHAEWMGIGGIPHHLEITDQLIYGLGVTEYLPCHLGMVKGLGMGGYSADRTGGSSKSVGGHEH